MSTYAHGVYVYEEPTSLIPPRRISAGIPFVVGTAPGPDGNPPVNKPIICFSFEEFVDNFGYSDEFDKYTLCEFAKVFFELYRVAPAVFVNVFDPATNLNADGNPDPTTVTDAQVIGSVDPATGAKTGLELISEVFPRFRVVPGLIACPKFSSHPAVAVAMSAKAHSINGLFKAYAVADIPVSTVTGYSGAPAYKNDNGLTDEKLILCWPKVKFGDEVHHLSSHLCGLMASIDAENEDVPYKSPSNEVLNVTGACLDTPDKEVWLTLDEANYLNGNGIVTALNFVGGWKAWGNRTAAYPGETDPIKAFIPVGRMFSWFGNEIVLTFWQKVDSPIRRRLIETVVDSLNIRLNGLAAREYILGGRVEFRPEENPTTDLIDGIITFHVFMTPPAPAREMKFLLEFDPTYVATMFK